MAKLFKGPAALAVDAWYSTGDVQANLEEARDYLQSGRPFAAIVQDLNAAGRGRPEFVHPLAGRPCMSPARGPNSWGSAPRRPATAAPCCHEGLDDRVHIRRSAPCSAPRT
jgi:hypothetical protein